MDESIRNAEKLIEATNSALERMRYDASCDDFSYIVGADKNDAWKRHAKPALSFDEEDFTSFLEPRDRNLFTSPDRGNPGQKIDEINDKIEAYKQELREREERESLRSFRFDQNELILGRSAERVVPPAKAASDTNVSAKSKSLSDDLRSKLLQTQEIVNRGIRTARELSETVDALKHRPLKSDRYDEVSLYKSRSSDKVAKSDSRSTIKTVDLKRCKRCNSEIAPKKGDKRGAEKNEENIKVVSVRGRDSPPRRVKRLNFQNLPSLSIQGDLRCQKIPSVDIPPGERERVPERANTAFQAFTHEQILRARIERIMEDARKSDSVVLSESVKGSKSVECSNCGKVIQFRDRVTDTRRVDELLKMCDYNVFDPRIDEFAERYRVKIEEEAKSTQTETEPRQPERDPASEIGTKLKISDLSSELTKKYREKAAELESDHLQFENILRGLFKEVDESRAWFNDCGYWNAVAPRDSDPVPSEKNRKTLTATTPVLLSYTGSGGEEADQPRPTRAWKTKMSGREIRKTLEKRELRTNCKLLTRAPPEDKGKVELPRARPCEAFKPAQPSAVSSESDSSVSDDKSKKELANRRRKIFEKTAPKPEPTVKEADVPKPTQIPSPPPVHIDLAAVEGSAKHTVSDYESDFEEESIEEIPEKEEDENSYKFNTRLSTISEVDSEVDRKLSDLSITPKEVSAKTGPQPPVMNSRKDSESLKSRKTSPCSSASSGEDDTRKLLRKVNSELKEIASQELLSARRGSAAREMTQPLKEVLNALKNQFQRTELLADKLSESIKEVNEVKKPETREDTLLTRKPELMIGQLERARKKEERKSRSNGRVRTSSEGEVVDTSPEPSAKSGREARTSRIAEEVSPMPRSGRDSRVESYSEGEISEQEILCTGGSSPSIGEVINANYSDGSLSEENSIIKFDL